MTDNMTNRKTRMPMAASFPCEVTGWTLSTDLTYVVVSVSLELIVVPLVVTGDIVGRDTLP